MLGVVTENEGNRVIVRCRGRLVAGENSWNVYNTVIVQRDANAFTIDLTGVDRIDAGGLGVLVVLKQWTMGVGAKLELVPSKTVMELIEVTGLRTLFEIPSPESITGHGLLNDSSGDSARQCA